MSNDLSGIDMAELRKMLADPMTRAHAFKELDGRIVKRLHEILKNADLKKLSSQTSQSSFRQSLKWTLQSAKGLGI